MSRLLTLCLISSLTAHAAILLTWAVAPPTLALTSTETAPTTLSVTLNSDNDQEHAAAKQITKHSKPQPHAVTLLLMPTNTNISPHVDTQEQQATPSAIAKAPLQDKLLRSKILSLIQADFSEHFYYPMLARRKGWQGDVLIGFWVEANGAISNARITQGSGFPLLDESALSALQKMQHIPNATEWLRGSRMELSLPVLFRLQGS